MKRLLLSLMTCWLAFQVSAEDAEKKANLEWMTDLPKALAKAKAEDKHVLLNFTGSDWCGWCIRLHKEVFSKPEFAEYANKNLVLVEVDFPNRKKQSAELKKANNALQEKYGIEGYPTIVILNKEGKLTGKTGYVPGGPKPFIASVEKAKKS
jgi:protein disulfide-isomerase